MGNVWKWRANILLRDNLRPSGSFSYRHVRLFLFLTSNIYSLLRSVFTNHHRLASYIYIRGFSVNSLAIISVECSRYTSIAKATLLTACYTPLRDKTKWRLLRANPCERARDSRVQRLAGREMNLTGKNSETVRWCVALRSPISGSLLRSATRKFNTRYRNFKFPYFNSRFTTDHNRYIVNSKI